MPILGTHEHENMSSRKKKKMNESSKRKNNLNGNIYNRDSHWEGESDASCSSDKKDTQAKGNNSKEKGQKMEKEVNLKA